MDFTPSETVMDFNSLQLRKEIPKYLTPFGIIIDSNFSHPVNAKTPILVRLSGIVMD